LISPHSQGLSCPFPDSSALDLGEGRGHRRHGLTHDGGRVDPDVEDDQAPSARPKPLKQVCELSNGSRKSVEFRHDQAVGLAARHRVDSRLV
jgi:hypothetical protein